MPIKTFKQNIEIRTMAETQFPICSCRLYIIFFASAVRAFFSLFVRPLCLFSNAHFDADFKITCIVTYEEDEANNFVCEKKKNLKM